MKRSLFTKFRKGALLMVPTSALMLGAAQAQTTVGLNFQAWYYDSGNTPQTVGFGTGYQTTGFPVTGRAFGVPVANWSSADPLPPYSFSGYATFGGVNTAFAGGLTAYVTSPDAWESGIGELNAGFNGGLAETVAPGNNEVTWGYLDDANANGQSPQVTVSGLAAKYPYGYVVQTIAAEAGVTTFDGVDLNDGTTDSPVTYTTYYVANNPAVDPDVSGGTVGLSTPSATFTGDTLSINCNPKDAGNRSTLAGFIITDVPVVTRNVPTSILQAVGSQLVLPTPADIIGIGLQYQWQHAGTNLPEATFSSYTNDSLAIIDAGLYQAVVTSSYYPSLSVTGQVANVSVIPTHAARTAYWDPVEAGQADDGSGIWSYTQTNWWSGTIDDYWGTADTAVFGAGVTGDYTVTLDDSITANSIVFNSGVYTITNSSDQTLTLSGLPALTAIANGTITVPVRIATNILVKEGAGAVTLSGSLTSTNVIVGAGTLQVLAVNGDAAYVVSNTATLKLGYSTEGGYANTAMQLYGNGASATTGFYLAGGQNYNCSGTITLLGAPTTIRQYGSGLASLSIFDNNDAGLYATAAASGSATDPNIQMTTDGYGMVITTDAGANTTNGDLVVNGPLNVNNANSSAGLAKKGLGSVRLNGVANVNNLGLNVTAGTVICGISNCIGTNAFLQVHSGATLDLNGTSQAVSNAVLAGTLKMTINKGGTPNCNTLTCWGQAVTLGGTLVVTNVGATVALGDTFTLFPVPGNGAFTSLQLPEVNGLAWQDNTAVNGTIQVIAGSMPPGIVTDLSGATNYAFVGGSCTFSITASGDPILQYQWRQNGATVVGSGSPTLTLTSLTLGSAGYYSCTVTNNFGKIQSQTNYLVVIAPASAGLAAEAMAQDTPKSFWPLNETNPPTAYDYWGGNNGTQNGSLTLGVAGPQPPAYEGFNSGNTAYQFDGATTYIDCGTGPSFSGTTDFTVEGWINTTSTVPGEIIQQRSTLGYDGTANGYNGEYQLSVNGNGTVAFDVFGDLSTEYNITSSGPTRRVNDGKWHHIAAERSDGTNGFIYIDGSLVATGTNNIAAPLDPTIATFIGADQRGSSTYFNGSICDVAVYNHALSAARIGEHAAAGVLGAAPLKLKLVSGGWIEDSKPSGTPHDGENLGVSWVATNTDVNSVSRAGMARFSSGAQIAAPANPDFNSPTGTICFWMLTPIPPAGNGTMLVDRRTTAGMVVFLDGTPSGGIDIQYTGNTSLSAGGYVIDGNWHHVAVTYDQSASGTVAIYVDGSLAGSQPNTAAWSWDPAQEIELGRSHDTYWQEYNGLIDDFRIYNRVLSSTEITEISTPATSDSVLDSTLMARYNFDTAAGVGTELVWPQVGVVQSMSALGSPAVWTPIKTTAPSYPFLPPYPVTNAASFYQLEQ